MQGHEINRLHSLFCAILCRCKHIIHIYRSKRKQRNTETVTNKKLAAKAAKLFVIPHTLISYAKFSKHMFTDFNGICVWRTAVAFRYSWSKFRYDCGVRTVLLPFGQTLYYEGRSYVISDVTAKPLICVVHRLGRRLLAGFE
jgi:hypothetical protein